MKGEKKLQSRQPSASTLRAVLDAFGRKYQATDDVARLICRLENDNAKRCLASVRTALTPRSKNQCDRAEEWLMHMTWHRLNAYERTQQCLAAHISGRNLRELKTLQNKSLSAWSRRVRNLVSSAGCQQAFDSIRIEEYTALLRKVRALGQLYTETHELTPHEAKVLNDFNKKQSHQPDPSEIKRMVARLAAGSGQHSQ